MGLGANRIARVWDGGTDPAFVRGSGDPLSGAKPIGLGPGDPGDNGDPGDRAPRACKHETMKPFRFLAEPGDVTDGRSVAEVARRAESVGYSVLVYPDHLIHPFAVVPLLATVAAATERLRIAGFVLNNDLRHPAVLAQELASLDVLSGGPGGGRHRRRLEPAGVRRSWSAWPGPDRRPDGADRATSCASTCSK